MKRTKNMIYKETTESRELEIVSMNDGKLYKLYALPFIETLKKKYQKGIYEPEKAIDLWFKMATAASNQYKKDFGYSFGVQDRFTVACIMERYYFQEYIEA